MVVWIDDAMLMAKGEHKVGLKLRLGYCHAQYLKALEEADVFVEHEGRLVSTRLMRYREREAAAKDLAQAIGVDGIRGIYVPQRPAATPSHDGPELRRGDVIAWAEPGSQVATVRSANPDGTLDVVDGDGRLVANVSADGLRLIDRRHVLGLASAARLRQAAVQAQDLARELLGRADLSERQRRSADDVGAALDHVVRELMQPVLPDLTAEPVAADLGTPLRTSAPVRPGEADPLAERMAHALLEKLAFHGSGSAFSVWELSHACDEPEDAIAERTAEVVALLRARGYRIEYELDDEGAHFRIRHPRRPTPESIPTAERGAAPAPHMTPADSREPLSEDDLSPADHATVIAAQATELSAIRDAIVEQARRGRLPTVAAIDSAIRNAVDRSPLLDRSWIADLVRPLESRRFEITAAWLASMVAPHVRETILKGLRGAVTARVPTLYRSTISQLAYRDDAGETHWMDRAHDVALPSSVFAALRVDYNVHRDAVVDDIANRVEARELATPAEIDAAIDDAVARSPFTQLPWLLAYLDDLPGFPPLPIALPQRLVPMMRGQLGLDVPPRLASRIPTRYDGTEARWRRVARANANPWFDGTDPPPHFTPVATAYMRGLNELSNGIVRRVEQGELATYALIDGAMIEALDQSSLVKPQWLAALVAKPGRAARDEDGQRFERPAAEMRPGFLEALRLAVEHRIPDRYCRPMPRVMEFGGEPPRIPERLARFDVDHGTAEVMRGEQAAWADAFLDSMEREFASQVEAVATRTAHRAMTGELATGEQIDRAIIEAVASAPLAQREWLLAYLRALAGNPDAADLRIPALANINRHRLRDRVRREVAKLIPTRYPRPTQEQRHKLV